MVEAFLCQLLLNLLFAGAVTVLHRRTRRMQCLTHAHLRSDHEHLQVTEELARRVANLDGKGLPEALMEDEPDESVWTKEKSL